MLNELHFSANGLGVVLKTKHGGLRFTTEEFGYYQNLFKIADNHNQGKLVLKSIQLNSLLIRTDISWPVVEKILMVVGKYHIEGEERDIHFYQWLILCKLIAFYQETKRAVSDKVFQKLHTTKIKIPFANFGLGQARQTFAVGTYYEELKVTLAEWIFSGEDYQNHHVKFRIETTSTPVKDGEGSAEGGPDYSSGIEKYSVERRYSEFETFASILQKNYKYVVVPPLPLKTWSFMTQSETTVHQRAVEFQMFLNDLTSHPVLRYSYELKAFLQSSSQGYKSFVDLYTHINDGKFVAVGSPTNQQLNEVVSKLFTDGAAAVTSSATSFFSSMWDSVRKNVPLLATPPPTRPVSSENDQKFQRTALMLEGVLNTGKRMESIVTNEREYYVELSKIALCYKYMAEFETIPELTRVLIASSTVLTNATKALLQNTDKQFFDAQIPLVYMGRYKDSFALVQQHRTRLEEEQHAAHRAEQFAQQSVDLAHTNMLSPGPSNGHGNHGHGNNGHGQGGQSNGSSPAVQPRSAGLFGFGAAPASPAAAASASSPSTSAAPTTATSVAISPGANTSANHTSSAAASSSQVQTLSQAEQRAAAGQQAYNQAKLDLVAAEDSFEQKRAAAEEMTASLRAESVRLELLERAQMVKCAKAFVYARVEAARMNVKFWEELKLELETTA